jgi:hypothetical protein
MKGVDLSGNMGNPIGSEWEAKSIFVLADASDIKEVGGKISFAMIE